MFLHYFVTIQSYAKLRSAMPKYAREAAGGWSSAMHAFKQIRSFIQQHAFLCKHSRQYRKECALVHSRIFDS